MDGRDRTVTVSNADFPNLHVSGHPLVRHKIRILAVTSAKRSGALPDIPTMAELGFKDFDITPWWGVLVPAGTPLGSDWRRHR